MKNNGIDYRADSNLAHHVIVEIQKMSDSLDFKKLNKVIKYYFNQLKKEPNKRVMFQE